MSFKKEEYNHILQNEPVGYRLVLEGNTDRIYIKCKGTFQQATLPKVPGCYLLNSTESIHMVTEDIGRKIIYIRGFVDPEKHRAIIEKNLSLYKDLALIEYS